MKHSIYKSYPSPVLRTDSDDFIDESFTADINVEFDAEKVRISIKYLLSSEEIKNEIFARNASYVSVVECKGTFYTKYVKTHEKSKTIEIDSGDLRGNVAVQSFVITENEFAIQSQNLNDEYRLIQAGENEEVTGYVNQFAYSQGDMIALTDPYLFAIDKEYFKPLQSCIDIDIDTSLKGGDWYVDTSEQHLMIRVSKEMRELWSNLQQTEAGKSALINSLYFTAITFAINCLKEEPELKASNKWAEIITAKINNKGINIEEDDYIITTKLLDEPLISLENISYGY
jgi:hypothetical protein